ncbi:transglutaminase-like domain-containing protein [Streptomyces sp. TR06-5]|uniref:transglutaminase-like domain-containing protein n=1 Tax=unclassified Streptomyces TaxID=2593676 RepID=UPI0039A31C7B
MSADDNLRERFRAAASEERVDLALLCLLIGTMLDPEGGGSTVDEAQRELDRLAGELPADLPGRGGGPSAPHAWAEALRELLGERHGFHGRQDDYRRLDSSLLQVVLRRRRGLPILLSVVWMEVARRAGGRVHGVALPGHFVVGFGDPAGRHVLADPFTGGTLLTERDAAGLVARATGSRAPAAVTPRAAGPLDIVLRVLNNIRAWAAARPEQSAVALRALDLSLLLPHHPARLRLERARLLVERGAFTAGARALEEYAEIVAGVEPRTAETVRNEARAARARLN